MAGMNARLSEIVHAIEQHYRARSSGTLFIVTGDNRSAKIVFVDGAIVAASLRHLLGMDALWELSSLTGCKCRFAHGVKMPARAQELLDTKDILRVLGEEETTILPKIPSPTASPELQGSAIGKSHDELLAILSNAAIEYLGPMAIPICREYFPFKDGPPLMPDLVRALNQLGTDMHDSHKHNLLVKKVLDQVK